MNKALLIFAVVFFLSLGFTANSHAGNPVAKSLKFTKYDSTKLVGSMVRTLDREELGRILDLEIDSQGHVAFALIVQNGFDEFPGRLVAVPFSALTVLEDKSQPIQVRLNVDKEIFYTAPGFDPEDLDNLQWAAGLYRFFGQQPYWTEEEAERVIKSPNQDCAYPYSLLGEWGCSLDGTGLFGQ